MRFAALLHLDHDEGLTWLYGIALLLQAGDPIIDFLQRGVCFFKMVTEFLFLILAAFAGGGLENSQQAGREAGILAGFTTSGEAEVSNDASLAPVLR